MIWNPSDKYNGNVYNPVYVIVGGRQVQTKVFAEKYNLEELQKKIHMFLCQNIDYYCCSSVSCHFLNLDVLNHFEETQILEFSTRCMGISSIGINLVVCEYRSLLRKIKGSMDVYAINMCYVVICGVHISEAC